MKTNSKMISIVAILSMVLSILVIFAPKTQAASVVQQLPAGAMYSNQAITYATILQSLSIAGQGQIATVNPGQSVSVSYTMQIFANPTTPGEIRQAFFAYSWASSWPPYSAYTAVYNGEPGLSPGVTQTDTFTIAVPTTPGNYSVWFLGESDYSMSQALSMFTTVPPVTPYAKIIVNPPPPVQHSLTINAVSSSAGLLASVTIGGAQFVTPITQNLTSGSFVVSIATSFGSYKFSGWQDGITAATRTINLQSDTTLTASYVIESSPLWMQWWFWTTVGLGVVAVVFAGTSVYYIRKPTTSKQTKVQQSKPLSETNKICPNCGANLPEDSKFCGKCGTSLE
jgi:ribosomal protein S27AE